MKPTMRLVNKLLILGIASIAYPAFAHAQLQIQPEHVLVVYNGAFPGANEVLHAYMTAHPTLPPENILNLDNPALSPTSNMTYTNFKNFIRNPIRDYLNQPGNPTPQDIVCILLIRPIPHRILDGDNLAICDNVLLVGDEILAGDAGCASVDADLVLLWQDLDAGEAGGTMDSLTDNFIDNPYHKSASFIRSISRATIQSPKTFTNLSNIAWASAGGANGLSAGSMYLVCRIDADTTEDAVAMIERSQNLVANRAKVKIILDEWDSAAAGDDLDDDPLFTTNDPFLSGEDYERTSSALSAFGWNVVYDNTFDFITGDEEPGSILCYASYGENHKINGFGEDPPGDGTYIETFNFARGAIFNTIESFNGRDLNTFGTMFGQEQVADFIGAGGSFGIGTVWEPLSFSVADNEFLFGRMLVNGRQFAEAAYQSIPVLSWHHVVIGDPLSRFKVVNDQGLPQGDLDGDGDVDDVDVVWFATLLFDGFDDYNVAFPALDPYSRGDFTGDYRFDGEDIPGLIDAYLSN